MAKDRYVKLGDLGLCKRLGEEGRAHTHVGTPGYMAPEVVHGQKNKTNGGYSYPADMWVWACMAWACMLEGQMLLWWAPFVERVHEQHVDVDVVQRCGKSQSASML